MANSRFIISTNILAILGSKHPELVSSRALAYQIGWQPSAIRRLVSPLIEVGIISSVHGAKGGMKLAKKPEQISLYEILKAVDTLVLFDINKFNPPGHSYIGNHLLDVLIPMIEDSLRQADKKLMSYKLSHILRKIT